MATDAKKHDTIAAGEAPTRARLAASIFSINDIIPVANATEANQVASAVAAAGQVLASDPVFVSRADARGLHRIEYSFDGTTWIPASGVLTFASKSAADSWATANSSLLVSGDICIIGGAEYVWTGTAWGGKGVLSISRAATQSIPNNTATAVIFTGGTLVTSGAPGCTIVDTTGLATVTEAGTFRVSGLVTYVGGGTLETHALRVDVNGTPVQSAGVVTNFLQTVSIEWVGALAVGDVVRLAALQVSGGAKNIYATGGYQTRLIIERIGA